VKETEVEEGSERKEGLLDGRYGGEDGEQMIRAGKAGKAK
jgi:hypothetical protein